MITTTTDITDHQLELLDISQVDELVGASEKTIRRWTQQRCFPSPIRIGPRMLRWRSNDIRNYLQKQAPVHGPESEYFGV